MTDFGQTRALQDELDEIFNMVKHTHTLAVELKEIILDQEKRITKLEMDLAGGFRRLDDST